MKRSRLHLLILLISSFIVTTSCSQNNSISDASGRDLFVGSTPCDSLVKSLLQIPSTTKCEFIKWELGFQKSNKDAYELTALYGESQPNTNGFKGGGEKISIKGKYITRNGIASNPGLKVYYLSADKLPKPLLLIQMDKNIFHFADEEKNFIVGNGGWGYVLNKVR